MTELQERLVSLRDALRDIAYPLDLPDADAATRTKVELLDQLDDYILPRLAQLDAPLVAVLGARPAQASPPCSTRWWAPR